MDHAVSQFAGEIGLLSFGLGKDVSRYSISGMYGFVPSELAGGPFIETITLRQTYRFWDWKRLGFYTGLNVFHVVGLHYEASQHGDPPDGYYPLGSVRALLYLGASVNLDKRERNHVYFEGGINDIWLTNRVSNKSGVSLYEHISLALGLKHQF